MHDAHRRNLILAPAAAALAGIAPSAFAQAAPFRIGALNPVTGAGSPYGPGMQKAILMAVDEINAAGGAGGRKLEAFAEDTQTRPEAAVLADRKSTRLNSSHVSESRMPSSA